MPVPSNLTEPAVRFGVDNLDMLLGKHTENHLHGYGKSVEDRFSMTISGRHGLGKSVMALHAISDYASRVYKDNLGHKILCLYISTDLSFEKAQETWHKFSLDFPHYRRWNLFGDQETADRRPMTSALKEFKMPLYRVAPSVEWLDNNEYEKLDPVNVPSAGKTVVLSEILAAETCPTGVAFLDLESMTGGDDWGLVTNIIAALQPRKPSGTSGATNPEKGLHFVVIDALEGLSFINADNSLTTSNALLRAQIEQILRDAKDTAHLLMISEASQKNQDAAENYVADVVVRLSHEPLGTRYLAKMVSIEKTRSQGHISGKHNLLVRSGKAGSTGFQPHYDEPEKRQIWSTGSPDPDCMAYVDVFHSIDFIDTQFRRKDAVDAARELQGVCDFGIDYLDDLLSHESSPSGLKIGTVTAIVGSPKSYKSLLSYHFLSRAFNSLLSGNIDPNLGNIYPNCYADNATPDAMIQDYKKFWKDRDSATPNNSNCDYAILFTTLPMDSRQLTKRMAEILGAEKVPCNLLSIENNVVVRRIELQTMGASGFYKIIESSVSDVLKRIHGPDFDWRNAKNSAKEKNGNVRVVIDNWAAVVDTYPEVSDDPLLLPNILALFRRTGVTAIIVESQTQESSHPQAMLSNSKLSRMVDHVINTWTVTIDDRKVVAISHAGIQDRWGSTLVRELKAFRDSEFGLYVDPQLEIYGGVEEGKLDNIPIRIRLFTESKSAETYTTNLNNMLKRMFVPQSGYNEIVSTTSTNQSTLMSERYERLQSSVRLHRIHLKETVIWQVAEFWSLPRSENKDTCPGVSDISSYIDGVVHNLAWKRGKLNELVDINDPYGVFRPTEGVPIGPHGVQRREDLYPSPNLKHSALPHDRHPYIWDFGFLAIRRNPWKIALSALSVNTQAIAGNSTSNNNTKTVIEDLLNHGKVNCNWRDFFATCREVARLGSIEPPTRNNIFSIPGSSKETWSCFLLEVWMSEYYSSDTNPESGLKHLFSRKGETVDKKLQNNTWLKVNPNKKTLMRPRNHGETIPEFDFRSLLDVNNISLSLETLCEKGTIPVGVTNPLDALLNAALLIVTHVDIDSYADHDSQTMDRHPDNPEIAMASRVWYKTCPDYYGTFNSNDPIAFRALPGNFSTRGDYFLAIAAGSQSQRLGYRALDLMSSISSNVERTKTGVGLESRRIHKNASIETCLWTDESKPNGFTRPVPRRLMSKEVVEFGRESEPDFHWLWRSCIPHYEPHQHLFQKFIYKIMVMLNGYRSRYRSEWIRGVVLVDALRGGNVSLPVPIPKFYKSIAEEFVGLVNDFIVEMDSTSPSVHDHPALPGPGPAAPTPTTTTSATNTPSDVDDPNAVGNPQQT